MAIPYEPSQFNMTIKALAKRLEELRGLYPNDEMIVWPALDEAERILFNAINP